MNELYDVHYIESSDSAIITLKEQYSDVKFTYGEVKFVESREEDYCTLSFDYDIIDPSTYEKHELENDNDFARHIGSILENVIYEAVKAEEYRIGKLNAAKNSNNNSKELT